MVNCLMCGERITSTTTDTLCVPCRREKRRYIQEVVNTWDTDPYNDLVADLRKLVEEMERRPYRYRFNFRWANKIKKLIGDKDAVDTSE